MSDSQWEVCVDMLKEAGIRFDAGLTEAEVAHIEAEHGFRYPPDLRDFLQTALPVSDGFPNWRHDRPESLRDRLAAPLEGILFDVEHIDFWLPEWGPRPDGPAARKGRVSGLVAAAPKLIPIYSHRMMPDRPREAGNPVFSVHQTDIIYYGIDLRDYLIHEFSVDSEKFGIWPIPDSVRSIEFWDIRRFFDVRWSRGYAVFDNRKGILP